MLTVDTGDRDLERRTSRCAGDAGLGRARFGHADAAARSRLRWRHSIRWCARSPGCRRHGATRIRFDGQAKASLVDRRRPERQPPSRHRDRDPARARRLARSCRQRRTCAPIRWGSAAFTHRRHGGHHWRGRRASPTRCTSWCAGKPDSLRIAGSVSMVALQGQRRWHLAAAAPGNHSCASIRSRLAFPHQGWTLASPARLISWLGQVTVHGHPPPAQHRWQRRGSGQRHHCPATRPASSTPASSGLDLLDVFGVLEPRLRPRSTAGDRSSCTWPARATRRRSRGAHR